MTEERKLSTSETTAVPLPYITSAGYVSPTESDILTGFKSDWSAALGGNGNTGDTTPQGQMCVSQTAICGAFNDVMLEIFNGVDPRNATGRLQDAIGYIYWMTRNSGETAAQFEVRRQETVEGNSVGVNAAILTAILNVPNLTDAYVVDNPTNAAVTVGGVSIAANSLYCSVFGGTNKEIALAIISKKPPGCSYTGGTTVTVQDPATAYNGNGPSYEVSFDVAEAVQIYFAVTIKSSSLVPSNANALIQEAIETVFTGQSSVQRATIGSTIYASSYYSAIASIGSWVQIETIKVGTTASPTTDFVTPNINQVPAYTLANTTLILA